MVLSSIPGAGGSCFSLTCSSTSEVCKRLHLEKAHFDLFFCHNVFIFPSSPGDSSLSFLQSARFVSTQYLC